MSRGLRNNVESSPPSPRPSTGALRSGPIRFLKSILRLFFLTTLFLGFALLGFGHLAVVTLNSDLPGDLSSMREPPSIATLVYSADGELIGEFYSKRRKIVSSDRIPEHMQQAIVAAEDARFWKHPGFDPLGIIRAAISNFKGGGSRQGASTITQQLSRMLVLSQERTYYRKLKELVLAVRVENFFDKRAILEMYLNRVYLGSGAYGVQAASETYFGKNVEHLTVAEAAMLAGMVQRPSARSPKRDLLGARGRRTYVLRRMVQDGYISNEIFKDADNEPVHLMSDTKGVTKFLAPYFVEHVRKWAQRKFGQEIFQKGLRIYTTLKLDMQKEAELAVQNGLESLDEKLGFQGPLKSLNNEEFEAFKKDLPKTVNGFKGLRNANLVENVAYIAGVTQLLNRFRTVVSIGQQQFPMLQEDSIKIRMWRGDKKERIKRGDTLPVKIQEGENGLKVAVLAQSPKIEAALVSMDPTQGTIKALVGGYSYQRSMYNRATQAKRQIGSAFKPFIYATAMQNGMSPVEIVSDSPVHIKTSGGVWSPRNYDGSFRGNVSLRTALAKSINTVSVRLVQRYGVDAVIRNARALGIRSKIPRHISIALGTPDMTLLEVVSAYCGFANGGKEVENQELDPKRLPGRFVDLVTKEDGTILADYRKQVPHKQAISPALSYMVADLMKAVVERGTAKNVLALGRPAAGKTGTSTNWRDAWFLGYTADLVTGVWVGRDDFKQMGEAATGGGAALPIWLQYNLNAHPATAVRDFTIPDDVVLVRANEMNGKPVFRLGDGVSRLIPFERGNVPARYSKGTKLNKFRDVEKF